VKKVDRIIELLEQLLEHGKAKQDAKMLAALEIVRLAALALREPGYGPTRVNRLIRQFEEKYGRFEV
jgi:hypothetical protein